MSLQKIVIITGGSSGIGEACVNAFLESGHRVFNFDVAESKKEDDRYTFVNADVSNSTSLQNAFSSCIQDDQKIDILVNSAGIQHYGTVQSTTEEEWDRVMEVNLKGSFLASKFALERMEKGVIINIASIQSLHSQKNVAPYTSSKSALLGLTRSIAVDFAPKIRCVAVCPGSVDTSMLRESARQSGDEKSFYSALKAMHLSQRIAEASEIASLVKYLTLDEASFITGQAIRIDGGLGVALEGSVD